jgi:transcriptional regulator NrdR family protein
MKLKEKLKKKVIRLDHLQSVVFTHIQEVGDLSQTETMQLLINLALISEWRNLQDENPLDVAAIFKELSDVQKTLDLVNLLSSRLKEIKDDERA